jgi:hypothetical protein
MCHSRLKNFTRSVAQIEQAQAPERTLAVHLTDKTRVLFCTSPDQSQIHLRLTVRDFLQGCTLSRNFLQLSFTTPRARPLLHDTRGTTVDTVVVVE